MSAYHPEHAQPPPTSGAEQGRAWLGLEWESEAQPGSGLLPGHPQVYIRGPEEPREEHQQARGPLLPARTDFCVVRTSMT